MELARKEARLMPACESRSGSVQAQPGDVVDLHGVDRYVELAPILVGPVEAADQLLVPEHLARHVVVEAAQFNAALLDPFDLVLDVLLVVAVDEVPQQTGPFDRPTGSGCPPDSPWVASQYSTAFFMSAVRFFEDFLLRVREADIEMGCAC